MTIDLNSDLGESFGRWTLGDDEAVLAAVTSANVACGFHAGDPLVMRRTVRAALARGVAVGAHPGYHDLRGFGRIPQEVDPEALAADVLYQIGALAAIARAEGAELAHVKPHGALYNRMAADAGLSAAIAGAVRAYHPELPLTVLAGSAGEEGARRAGARVLREGFVDRAYTAEGALVDRRRPGAVHTEIERVVEQALALATRGEVRTLDGTTLHLRVDTLCLHGDTPAAAELARRVRTALEAAGVTVARPAADA